MKILVLFTWFLIVPFCSDGQLRKWFNNSKFEHIPPDQRIVNISGEKLTMEKVIRMVEKQTHLRVFYDVATFKDFGSFHVTLKGVQLNKALTVRSELLLHFEWRFGDSYLILCRCLQSNP